MSVKERNLFLEELWARHVPDKNVYELSQSGRKQVVRRVFQRHSAPVWAFYDCRYCVDPDIVCRKHQFVIFGHDGVRRYVESWEQGRFARRRPSVVRPEEPLTKIMVDYLQIQDGPHRLANEETADRADIIDECFADFRSLWYEFRLCRGDIFLRDTGVHLPVCVRFPQSNLYRAFRENHAAR